MASLAEAFYRLPTERLRSVVAFRRVDPKKLALIPDKRRLAQLLASELNQPQSVIAAIMVCSARELRLLQLLLMGESHQVVPWATVLEAAGGPDLAKPLEGVLRALEDKGLAFQMANGVYVPEAVRQHVPASLPDRYLLSRCLNAYDVPTLKHIAYRLGLRVERDVKQDLTEAIRACLIEGAPGLRFEPPLDEEERAVLEYLVQVNGVSSALEVASAVLGGRTDDFFRYAWQDRWKQGRERNAVDRLLARGLLHVVAHGYGFNLFLVVPGDLLRALSGGADQSFWTAPPPVPQPLAAPPAAVTRHATLLRDVVGLLAALAAQEAVRTSTGHIHKASLKNIMRALSLPEERYASFLYALCREAELIAPQGEKQIYALTAHGEAWLCADPLTQIRALYAAWHNGTTWAEMYEDPLKKAGDYRPTDGILRMRHAVLELLASHAGDPFLEIGSLADTLAFRCPLLLTHGGRMGEDLVPSPLAFVRALVGECLAWIGLVELGWQAAPAQAKRETGSRRGETAKRSAPPEAAAWRLTPLGAFLLGVPQAEEPAEEPREQSFILQANAEIFVPPYLDASTLYRLLTLTEPPAKGAAGNTVSLTRESIRRALDRGQPTHEILAFLQAHARTGIPQNVEYLIQEVGGKHGHIRIGRAQMYLQVDSPLLLKELQARRDLKNYFVRVLSDTVALLRADDPEKLLRELRKAGYLPISDDADAEPAFRQETRSLSAETSFRFSTGRHSKESKSLEGALNWERIAQEDGKPWSVETAAGGHGGDTVRVPMNALGGRKAIEVLMSIAILKHRCVEIALRPPRGKKALRYTIEPRKVGQKIVIAINRANDKLEEFDLDQVAWARLLDERT